MPGDWNEYLHSLAQPTTWGDHISLLAAAELLERPIFVHSIVAGGEFQVVPTIGDPAASEEPEPIQLAFEHELHYQAVVPGVEGDSAAADGEDPDVCEKCGSLMLQNGCINPACPDNKGQPSNPGSDKPAPEEPVKQPPQGRICSICGERGHYMQTCPKRDANLKKQGVRGSSTPEEWSNFYSYGEDGGK